MPHSHLRLHCLEVIRLASLDFSAHSLASPLLQAANSLVHMHGDCCALRDWDEK